jgi:hypothetical protein
MSSNEPSREVMEFERSRPCGIVEGQQIDQPSASFQRQTHRNDERCTAGACVSCMRVQNRSRYSIIAMRVILASPRRPIHSGLRVREKRISDG